MAEEEEKDTDPEEPKETPIVEIKQDWADDLQICLTYLTRIPVPGGLIISDPSLAQSSRFFPVIGCIIGFVGAIVIITSNLLGLPSSVSAALALICITMITGGLHEKGIADVVQAIGSDVEKPEKRLQIMQAGRVNTLGVLTLIFFFFLKWSALASLSVSGGALAVFAMAVISLGGLPVFMRYIPPAKKRGVSKLEEQPEFDRAAVSLLLSFAASLFAVGFWLTSGIVIVLSAITALTSWWFKRLFGGHTKEVLGALQQISEICVILTIAALGI